MGTEAERRVRAAASDPDRAAVERQCACADADAVGVTVRGLHRVDEPQRARAALAWGVIRLPGHRTDRQRKLRRTRHVHWTVESHGDGDVLRQLERAGSHQIHAVHARCGLAAAVHLVVRRVGDGMGAEPEHGVRRAALLSDRPAVERQRAGADADAIRVRVRRLDFVGEQDGAPCHRQGVHLPRCGADGQR